MSIDADRRRVVQTLTFWLRPRFVLRVVSRFQRIAGFDRAIALGSSALTAIIPLAIVTSVVASALGGKDTADRIIERYHLTGGGAEAVEAIFAPASGTSTSLGIIGFLFLLLAVLSFTRAVQRLFEQTWGAEAVERAQHAQRRRVDRPARGLPRRQRPAPVRPGTQRSRDHRGAGHDPAVTGLPDLDRLAAQRAQDRARDLVPFAVIAAVASAVYSVGANVYVPRLFDTYATRYGVIGAVFALITALFCVMVVVAGSAAAGREVQLRGARSHPAG